MVTGASRGIGAATAQALAIGGAQVILVARTQTDLDKQVTAIQAAGGTAYAYVADLSDLADIEALAARIRQEHGVPHILVNNAGAGRWLYTEETPAQEAEMMIRLPYMAAFHLCREFLPGMLTRKSGHIVNVNSPASVMTWSSSAGYSASRWALRGLSEALKVDLHGTGLGISHCVFGEVSSNYFAANPESHEKIPKISRLIPVSSPEQVAKWILLAIRQEKKEMTKPFILRTFRFFHWLFPPLVKWMVRTSSHQRP